MRKIYKASGNLFTLIAETDRVLCRHLAMFLTVFSTGCTKWNTAAIKILLLFTAGLFIGIWLRSAPPAKVIGNPIRRFRLSPCLRRKRFEKSQAMMAFRTWISTGKPEQLLYLMFVCFFFRLAFENENCCLCKCFTDIYFFYWLLEVSLAILIKVPVVFSLT